MIKMKRGQNKAIQEPAKKVVVEQTKKTKCKVCGYENTNKTGSCWNCQGNIG